MHAFALTLLILLQAEESARQVIQAATLLKTIYFLTDSDVNVIILNNDVEVFSRIRGQLEEWEMSIGQHFRLFSSLNQRKLLILDVQTEQQESVLPARPAGNAEYV